MADPVKTDALQPAIQAALKKVFDPEIPVNIYELGLIYDVFVDGRRRRRDPDDADRAGVSGGADPAGAGGRGSPKAFPGSPTRRSTSSGNRAGPRTGCRTLRNCNWGCGEPRGARHARASGRGVPASDRAGVRAKPAKKDRMSDVAKLQLGMW